MGRTIAATIMGVKASAMKPFLMPWTWRGVFILELGAQIGWSIANGHVLPPCS